MGGRPRLVVGRTCINGHYIASENDLYVNKEGNKCRVCTRISQNKATSSDSRRKKSPGYREYMREYMREYNKRKHPDAKQVRHLAPGDTCLHGHKIESMDDLRKNRKGFVCRQCYSQWHRKTDFKGRLKATGEGTLIAELPDPKEYREVVRKGATYNRELAKDIGLDVTSLLIKPYAQSAYEDLKDAIDYDDENGHKRNCYGREPEFSDYVEPPTDEVAAKLCSECPLFDICGEYGRRENPAWGINGGVVYGREELEDN